MGILHRFSRSTKPNHSLRRRDTIAFGSPPAVREGVTFLPRPPTAIIIGILLVLALFVLFATTAYADTKTQVSITKSNGIYTVIVTDEAGNTRIRQIEIDFIEPDYIYGDDGETIERTDSALPDEYVEDILATVFDEITVHENGTYTIWVEDEAGLQTKMSRTIQNIDESAPPDGKDTTGSIIPDSVFFTKDDYTEDVATTVTGETNVYSNGTYTVFIRDAAGNMTKRTTVPEISNIIEETTGAAGDDAPLIEPSPLTPTTDEDYTEEIRETLSTDGYVTSNGVYRVIATDEAGNMAISAEFIVTRWLEDTPVEDPENPEITPIAPDIGAETNEEDYTEVIIDTLTVSYFASENGIYAAIASDNAGLTGIDAYEVELGEPNPDDPDIDLIKPDTPGSEDTSIDGNTMTSETEVFENGFYTAAAYDNVENIGTETIMVRNIGAPDVKIIQNPASLQRKTNPDGSTYGEATITFTVTVPDGALLTDITFLDPDDNILYAKYFDDPTQVTTLPETAGVYKATVTENGIYHIAATDVAQRDAYYPVVVDYIFQPTPPDTYEAMEGDEVILEANVEGGSATEYQWYKRQIVEDGENVLTRIPGATAPEYSFTAEYTDNDTYYVVAASNGDYEAVSKPIHVIIYFPPKLTTQPFINAIETYPVRFTSGHGASDTVRIRTDGNPDGYSYQWYMATTRTGEKTAIPGATSASYEMVATTDMHSRYFFLEITTDKCVTMSDPILLYVSGKPSAPNIVAKLNDGTILESGEWALEDPVTVTIEKSTVSGYRGAIEYKYSYDGRNWFPYEAPLVFEGNTDRLKIYAKAVNIASLAEVDSDISEHMVCIELIDPVIHEDEDDIVPGVQYDKDVWTSKPTPIYIAVDTISGAAEIKVEFKGEGEAEYHELVREDGSNQYQLVDNDVELDATNFHSLKVTDGLYRVVFLAEENGHYKVSFKDAAGRPLGDQKIQTQPFEVTHIDYGRPVADSILLDTTEESNEKTITVTNVRDEYTDSTYGFSQVWAFAYVKDDAASVDPESIPLGDWTLLDGYAGVTSTTTDGNGVVHYTFDIDLAGAEDNGKYHIFVRDLAGNCTNEVVINVTGLYDKMQDVEFGDEEPGGSVSMDLTVPDVEYLDVTFVGQAKALLAESSNSSVVVGEPTLVGDGHWSVAIRPVDMGTGTLTLRLQDYDGTEYLYYINATVRNMIPSVKTHPVDAETKGGTRTEIPATFNGTNLRYTWYVSDTETGVGTAIPVGGNYSVVINQDDPKTQTVSLVINNTDSDLNGKYFWCVGIATEGTPEHTVTTNRANLFVYGLPTTPVITATTEDGTITTGVWTNKSISFTWDGTASMPAGYGGVGYEYRFSNTDTYTRNSSNTTAYTVNAETHANDTATLALYVRTYNTAQEDVVSEDVEFLIRIDTVSPAVTSITGNPTEWVSEDQTLTIHMTDDSSGFSEDTINLTLADSVTGSSAKAAAIQVSEGEYTFTIEVNGVYTVTVHDKAGNPTAEVFTVRMIDKKAPTLLVTQDSSDGEQCRILLNAVDDASTEDMLLYTFDSGESWTAANWDIASIGETIRVGVKDAAGNTTYRTVKITGNSSGDNGNGGGGGYSAPTLIAEAILDVDGYTFGTTNYLNEREEVFTYPSYTVNGSSVTAYRVEVTAYPYADGVLYGYAKLSTGQKLPLYWDEAGTKTTSDVGGKAYVYLVPSQITQSVKNGTLSINIIEYSDETLSHKKYSDTITAAITLDVTAPVASISLNRATSTVTVSTRDSIAGIKEVTYATVSTSGAQSEFIPYTAPFTITEDTQYVIVRAVDMVNNTSETKSSDLTKTDGGGSGVGSGGLMDEIANGTAGDAYEDSYYYRTSVFNYWLIGTNKKN